MQNPAEREDVRFHFSEAEAKEKETKVEENMLYQRQQRKIKEIAQSLRGSKACIEDVQKELQGASVHIDRVTNKDLVLVLGVTGAGKSVLINYLKDCDFILKEHEETGHKFLAPKPGHEDRLYAKPGNGPESKTYYPQALSIEKEYKEEKDTTFYCDCPGHFDTNQDAKASASRLLVQQAIEKARSIKGIIICMPFSSMDTRLRDIRDLLVIMDGMFKNAETLNLPIIFVATKAEGKNTKQFVANINILLKSKKEMLETKRKKQEEIARVASERGQMPSLGNLPKEIEQLKKEIHLLSLITVDSSLVINPMDEGESREIFKKKLDTLLSSQQNSNGVNKRVFHISQNHGDQLELTNTIKSVIEGAIDLAASKRNLQTRIKDIKKELGKTNKEIKTTEDNVERLTNSSSILEIKETELADAYRVLRDTGGDAAVFSIKKRLADTQSPLDKSSPFNMTSSSGKEPEEKAAANSTPPTTSSPNFTGEKYHLQDKISDIKKNINSLNRQIKEFEENEFLRDLSESQPAAEKPGFWENVGKGILTILFTPHETIATVVGSAFGYTPGTILTSFWESAPSEALKLQYDSSTPFEAKEISRNNCQSQGSGISQEDGEYHYRAVYIGNDPYQSANVTVYIHCKKKYHPRHQEAFRRLNEELSEENRKLQTLETEFEQMVKKEKEAKEKINKLEKDIQEEKNKSKEFLESNFSTDAPSTTKNNFSNDTSADSSAPPPAPTAREDFAGVLKKSLGFRENSSISLKKKKLALENELEQTELQVKENKSVFIEHKELFKFGLEMAKLANYNSASLAACQTAYDEYCAVKEKADMPEEGDASEKDNESEEADMPEEGDVSEKDDAPEEGDVPEEDPEAQSDSELADPSVFANRQQANFPSGVAAGLARMGTFNTSCVGAAEPPPPAYSH